MGDTTTIEVAVETWKELNSRKNPGESFDDVIQRELGTDSPVETNGDSNATHGRENDRNGSPVPTELPERVDREKAKETFEKVAEFLRENGNASTREIVAAVMPEYPLGYDIPELVDGELVDRYRGAWWRKVVKPTLEASTDIEYRDNYSDYQFIGSELTQNAGKGE